MDDGIGTNALGANLLLGLAAAVAWSTATAIRLGSAPFPTFVAAFGCAAATACPLVALGRRATAPGSGLGNWIAAALLSLGPLAMLGGLLKDKTHHRPLGGVTFAVLAAAVFVAALVVASRLRRVDSTAPRRLGRAVLGSGYAVSLLLFGRALAPILGRTAPLAVRDAASDAALGALFVLMAVVSPTRRWPGWARWLGPLTWFGASALGACFVLADSAAAQFLAARAPMTLGIIGELCRP